MTYAKQSWQDSPAKTTPLSAARLNHMEDGIEAADATANAAVPSTRKVNGQALSGDVTLIASDVGLGDVDNTSDADKPVSTAAASALALKADADETVSGSANGTASSLTLWTGTDAQFAAVTEKDPHTVYLRPGGISIGASPVFTGVPRTYSVTVDHTKVSAAVADFPLFVDLSTMPGVFWSAVSNGGGDIRCYAGATELAREVVSCDTVARTGELHIKCDLSATADTAITITVDGSSPDYAPTDPFGRNAVWSNGYVVVSHDGGKTDSTANGFNGTLNGTVDGQALGKIGKTAQGYLSSGTYNFGSNPKLQSTVITASAWVKGTNTALYGIVSRSSGWILGVNAAGAVYGHNYTPPPPGIQGGPKVLDGTWHHIALVFQSGVTNGSAVYSDGVSRATGTLTYAVATSVASVGGTPSTLAAAVIDEVRISNIVRTAAWIAAEYTNQNTPSSFYTTTPA